MAKKIGTAIIIAGIIIAVVLFSWPTDTHDSKQAANSPEAEELKNDFVRKTIIVGDIEVSAFIADSPAKHSRGLMHVTSLNENEGMIFLFSDRRVYSFWNRNTLLDLDLIWIDGDRVVGVSSLPNEPKNGTITVSSPAPVDKVLEMSLGWSEKNQVSVGTKVAL